MFSILIATLNNEALLSECLYALQCMSKYHNQYVIYDNDSSDHTESMIKSMTPGPDISYKKGPNLGQYHALDDCYGRAKYDWCFRIHTDMFMCTPNWEDYFIRAIKKAMHPWKWLMCARSIEPIKGHTYLHIIKDYGPDMYKSRFDRLHDWREHEDNTIVTGYREPFLMHKKLYEQFDRDAMLKYKAYCGDDHTVQAAHHAGVRRFWMVNGVLVYHMVNPKGGQTNTSKDSQDKDQNWPYEFFVEYWKKHGYPEAHHPGQWHPQLIPQYIEV